MSTAVFGFRFLDKDAGGDYAATYVAVDELETAQGGRTAVIARASYSRFEATGTLIFPDKHGNKASDFWAFWAARTGRVDTFLFKALESYLRMVDGESIGTAAGGGGETFALDMRHVDSATLRVFVAGVEQTLTTDYTLSGNDTAPLITSTASMDTGAVTASYEFYQPVRFAMDRPRVRILKIGEKTWADQEAVGIGIDLIEDMPGRRYA